MRYALAPLLLGLILAGCGNTPSYDDRPAAATAVSHAGPVTIIAERLVGTPYRYGGSSPAAGFDCSGLVWYAYREAGHSVPRTSAAQFSASRPVEAGRLQPGDLLFFRIDGKPSHVGIYLGEGRFVHAPSSGKRVSYGSLDDPYWRAHLIRAGRL